MNESIFRINVNGYEYRASYEPETDHIRFWKNIYKETVDERSMPITLAISLPVMEQLLIFIRKQKENQHEQPDRFTASPLLSLLDPQQPDP